jgi:anhydro-N-acetylmuramic acid kinase
MSEKNNRKHLYTVLGLMSGTSVDGLDICAVEFWKEGTWKYKIIKASTLPYPPYWQEQLNYKNLSAESLLDLNHNYGLYLGEKSNEFLAENGLTVDFIASHGHTWFHQPKKGITYQLGCGPEIAAITGISTVTDFRKADVIFGGQGAPLVPIGDRDLFFQYQSCLNLGGFANISFDEQGKRVAFDICPVNISLNYYCQKLGLPFDDGGIIASTYPYDIELVTKLDQIDFYKQSPPKSLGIEWVKTEIFSLITATKLSLETIISSLSEHSARQISNCLINNNLNNCFISGGGALNEHLIDRIRFLSNKEILIAENQTLHFKEALIFGYLGLLAFQGEVNILSSVTGAKKDHCGGLIYKGDSLSQ